MKPKHRVYTDALGSQIQHDNSSAVSWRISGYVVATLHGKILLVDHPWANRWELPGGEIDVDEPLIEGASRECWEETGYRFHASNPAPRFVGEQFFYRRGRKTYHHSLILAFEGN